MSLRLRGFFFCPRIVIILRTPFQPLRGSKSERDAFKHSVVDYCRARVLPIIRSAAATANRTYREIPQGVSTVYPTVRDFQTLDSRLVLTDRASPPVRNEFQLLHGVPFLVDPIQRYTVLVG